MRALTGARRSVIFDPPRTAESGTGTAPVSASIIDRHRLSQDVRKETHELCRVAVERQSVKPCEFIDEVVDTVVRHIRRPHGVHDHGHNVSECHGREIVARSGSLVLRHAFVGAA